MTITRTAEAFWAGPVQEGSGSIRLGSGAFDGPYSVKSRTADGKGTNPEELIGGAHAGCYSMMLSALLSGAGTPPKSIHTTAKVQLERLEAGLTITKILLSTEAEVPGLDAARFQEVAEEAKKNCPVSRALTGVQIELAAKLL
jgi:lipoyl-dependent peroxiredoxin